MEFMELHLSGVFLFTPTRHDDNRGFFSENFRADKFIDTTGHNIKFVQDNLVHSAKEGTLRGLHYQSPPHEQGKLVTCLRGQITDVIVDIRRNKPSYGQSISVELSAKTGQSLWVPPGFAHGYITTADDSLIMYKVTDYYAPHCEGGLAYNDPGLTIDWGYPENKLIISDKDKEAQSFANFQSPFK